MIPAHFEPGKLRSELEGVCWSNLSLKRDVKFAKERFETAQARAPERDAAAAKLHWQVAEL